MERYLLETCYLLTRDLYQIFITFFAMSFMLKPRYHRAICVSASVLYSFASEQLLLDGPPLLHGVGIALSFFLPALFLYKDKLMYRLFAAGFLAAGSIIMDVCVSGFVMLIDVNLLVSLKTFHTWDTIIMIIAMNFFFTGGFLLIMSVWNHFFRKSHVKSLGLFVMFPVSQFFFFCACAYQTWTGERLDLISNPFIIIAVVLSIAADILMYRALMQNTRTQELTQKLNDMQHEMDMQLQYYDGLADKMREIREYRHDINNLIEVTESLLRRKTTSEDGRMLLEELKEKTANAGSSVGISKVSSQEELKAAIALALENDRKVVFEAFVDGQEVECAVIGSDPAVATRPGEILAGAEFYTYDDKYKNGVSQTVIPAHLPEAKLDEVKTYAAMAYTALNCEGLARCDFFVEKNTGRVLINEINTFPGFTAISMYPKLMEHEGLPVPQLIDRLIALAVERTEKQHG